MNLKYNCQRLVFSVLILLLNSKTAASDKDFEQTNNFTFKVKKNFTERIIRQFQKYDLSLLFKIPPTTYTFEYTGGGNSSSIFQTVLCDFKDEIVEAEPVRVYDNNLKPEESKTEGRENNTNGDPTNLVCSHYYGMDIPEAWLSGYTGTGVTFGITDVGINTDLLDLRQNINEELCHNFVDNTTYVAPGVSHNFQSENAADHGNRVASIVAATKGNNLCSAGVAYNAEMAALKIYEVRPFVGKLRADSNIISKGLTHRLDKIDIFVNAWTTASKFDRLDLSTREAFRHGAESGRNGLGAIYVVPAGPVGNGLSNNNNTITVNGIGKLGIIPDKARLDASVITSGLSQGNNLTASNMVTTSRNNRCITSFKGVSAAVAQVAAIIGLGLEANPNLTVRDVEHLLVFASEHRQLKETIAFTKNGAGHYYHGVFGFGLLNAKKFVTEAKQYVGTPQLEIRLLGLSKYRTLGRHTQEFKFCHSCEVNEVARCLTTVEYASVNLQIKTSTTHLQAELVSPRNTHSVIMDESLDQQSTPVYTETTIFSAHFWDEFAFGNWILRIHSHRDTSETTIKGVSLMLYGTMRSHVASKEKISICDKYFSFTSQTPQLTTAQPGNATQETEGLSSGIIIVFVPLIGMVCIIVLLCYIRRRRIHTAETSPNDQSAPISSRKLVRNENDHAQHENDLLDGGKGGVDENKIEDNNEEA